MNALVACEESQTVCTALRECGCIAFSADIVKPSGGHLEWHILGDCIPLLNGGEFKTMDGVKHNVYKWDLIIAHPPCTYLTCAANKYYNVSVYGSKAVSRLEEREKAVDFFMHFVVADCPYIAIENPVGVMSTRYRKPNQIIQPYEYGHNDRKSTCLWLKNLPNLQPTNIVEFTPIVFASGKTDSPTHYSTFGLPVEERRRIRSRTYNGIARAMASQWVNYIKEQNNEH